MDRMAYGPQSERLAICPFLGKAGWPLAWTPVRTLAVQCELSSPNLQTPPALPRRQVCCRGDVVSRVQLKSLVCCTHGSGQCPGRGAGPVREPVVITWARGPRPADQTITTSSPSKLPSVACGVALLEDHPVQQEVVGSIPHQGQT